MNERIPDDLLDAPDRRRQDEDEEEFNEEARADDPCNDD